MKVLVDGREGGASNKLGSTFYILCFDNISGKDGVYAKKKQISWVWLYSCLSINNYIWDQI